MFSDYDKGKGGLKSLIVAVVNMVTFFSVLKVMAMVLVILEPWP